MNANQSFGLVPEIKDHSQFLGELVAVGASFAKSGNCNTWDKKCIENEALLAKARLAEAEAAGLAAESNQQAEQQKMYLLAGGAALVMLFLMALMMKR